MAQLLETIQIGTANGRVEVLKFLT